MHDKTRALKETDASNERNQSRRESQDRAHSASAPAHVLAKNGVVEVAVTLPENPALHAQPLGTFVPAEFIGHGTAEHVGVAPAENEV